MKFPFFKGSKPEPKPTTAVFVPPRAAASKPTPSAPVAAPAPMPSSGGPSVPVRLNSILPQLPRDLFPAEHRSQVADLTLAVPSRLVLPQLSTGKVAVTLSDLAPLLPANLLNNAVLASAAQQSVLLPLPEMIAALPAEAFKVKHDAEVSLDEPEVAALPALFDKEEDRRAEVNARKAISVTAPAPTAPAPSPQPAQIRPGPPSPAPAIPMPAPVPASAAPVAAPAAAAATSSAPRAVEPSTPTAPAKLELPGNVNLPQTVQVSLRSLVNNMPEKLFVCPKADLWQKTDLDIPVPLPLTPIISQLTSARVTVPVSSILPLIPTVILVAPLPANAGAEMMPLPLFEIIPQLPAEIFTAQLSPPRAQDQLALDADIPAPFQERAKAVPLPAQPAEPAAPAAPAEVSEKDLEQEMPIFSEKRPARPLAETTRIQLPAGLAGRKAPAAPVPAPARLAPPTPAASPKPAEPVPVAAKIAEPPTPVEPPPPVTPPAPVAPVAVPEPPKPAEPVPAAVLAVETPTPVELPATAAAVVVAEPPQPAESLPVAAQVVEPSQPVEPAASVVPVEPEAVHPAPAVVEPPTAPEPEVAAAAVAPAPVLPAEKPAVVEPPPAAAAPVAVPVPAEPELAEEPEAEEEAVPARRGQLDESKFLVNINRCTVEDLLGIEGVGRKLAQRIIEFRESHGGFRSLEDLRQVAGVGRKTYRALAGIDARSLHKLLGVTDDRELSLQEIVKLTGQLKGIDGCMLAMADGIFLTGQLPNEFDQEAISVFAPQLFKKMGRYVKELRVGQVRRFTLFTDERPISIFRAADVYLIVVHDTRHFSKRLLRQCERISEELARLCRQRTVL